MKRVVILKKNLWRIAHIALAVLLAFTMTVSAVAADINLNKKGELYVSLSDPESKMPLDGCEIGIYKIADLRLINGEYYYIATDEYAAGDFDFSDISAPSLAEKVYDYIIDCDIYSEKTRRAVNGVASFANLECGLYLVENIQAVDGYMPFNSFLVSMPMMIGGKYIYDINATPKIEIDPQTNPGVRPPNDHYETDDPDNPPPHYPSPDGPEGDEPPGGVKPGEDFEYDEDTPPDVVLDTPEESNLVDFEKADITLKLFSADYSPAMKISLVVIGFIALILILILIFDKKSDGKKKAKENS